MVMGGFSRFLDFGVVASGGGNHASITMKTLHEKCFMKMRK